MKLSKSQCIKVVLAVLCLLLLPDAEPLAAPVQEGPEEVDPYARGTEEPAEPWTGYEEDGPYARTSLQSAVDIAFPGNIEKRLALEQGPPKRYKSAIYEEYVRSGAKANAQQEYRKHEAFKRSERTENENAALDFMNAGGWLWLLVLIACLFSTKILSINLRLKVVLAVPYALFWLAYVNETYPHGSPTIGEWLWLFIPMAWLFSTNIWRWARAG